ncbi:IS3 family transposase [Mycoplasma sp. 06067-C1-B144P-99-0482-3]|uniref:IS3 family transposase n=1 Tax=Mycoplasma sp. 06067-C1-B144P-99-0482-3 TaxID=3117438 RepID=UPI003DA45483
MKYSLEFKHKVFNEFKFKSLKELSSIYNINYNTLKYWKYQTQKILLKKINHQSQVLFKHQQNLNGLLKIKEIWQKQNKKSISVFHQIYQIQKEFNIPINKILNTISVSKSLYYKRLKQVEVNINKPNKLEQLIIKIFVNNHNLIGYRKIKQKLFELYNLVVNHKVILKIMRKWNLVVGWLKNKSKTPHHKSGKNKFNIPDLVNRDFNQFKQQGQVVYTDVTYITLNKQKYYLSTTIDGFSKEIIDYRISNKNDTHLVVKNLKHTIKKYQQLNIDISGLIIHSDHALVYESKQFRKLCLKYNIRQSMGVNYSCLDNAVIESFHGQLKKGTIHSNKKFYKSIFDYLKNIDIWCKWYNKSKNSSIKLNKRKLLIC